MRALLLLAVACAAEGPGDPEAYAEALASGDPAACAAVADPALAADCRAWLARERAVAGDVEGAAALCRALPEASAMRGECFFLVADGVSASGEQARSLCAQAAPYDQRCLEHAVRREVAAAVGTLERGEEAAVEARAEAVAAAWVGRGRGRRFARHILSKRIAERADQPFSAATCGTVSAVVCSRAFELRVDAWIQARAAVEDAHAKVTLEPVCPPPVTREAVAAAGGPLWAEDADGVVADAWRRACAKARDDRGR